MRTLIICLAFFVVVLAGGVFTPPAFSGTRQYYLFSDGLILTMDGEGNLSYYNDYPMTYGSLTNVTTSPDGRMVVCSGDITSPSMRIFFINDDGSVTPPSGISNPREPSEYLGWNNPVGFHHSLPLFYVGYKPISCYRYDTARHEVELTSNSIILDYGIASNNIVHSPWSNTLVLFKVYSVTTQTIGTISLKPDGSFGNVNPYMILPRVENSAFYFNASPDGRWAAAAQIGDNLCLIRINKDGSTTVTQQTFFPIMAISQIGYTRA